MLSFLTVIVLLSALAIGIKLLAENRSTYSRVRPGKRRFLFGK